MALKEHTSKAGESLCWIALEHDLEDCRRLLSDNPDLAPGRLPPGSIVLVPDEQIKDEDVNSEQLHPFLLGQDRVRIEFIRDFGAGDKDDTNVIDDPVIRDHLNITNYVVDRSGVGTRPGNWPGPDFYAHDLEASIDPDQFKVQVFDPAVSAGLEFVEVELFALKPSYLRRARTARVVRDRFARPTNPKRSLKVLCKRVGSSSFFRSPYLRLVTFETDRARRPKQCLLVSDYFDEGGDEFEKLHIEILHQQIEAHYRIPSCPYQECGVSRILPLPITHGVRLGFHVIGDPQSPSDQAVLDALRENVYTWTRRIFAAAGLMTPIVQARIVPPPTNVIFIGSLHNQGTQATGVGNFRVEFEVDGTPVKISVRGGATADVVARDIVAAITTSRDPAAPRALAGYTAVVKVIDANAARFGDAFNCHDVLVFKPDGAQAQVTNVSTNNAGLEVSGTDPAMFASGGFFLSADDLREGTPQERAVFWNYAEAKVFNCFVVPSAKIHFESSLKHLDGSARPGVIGPMNVSLGPCIYLTRNFANLPQLIAHELCHVLVHCEHADGPLIDAPPATADRERRPSTSELLGAVQSKRDTHDMDRHLSDFPIAAVYDVYELDGSLKRGQNLGGLASAGGRMCPFDASVPDTPVERIRHFARRYDVLRITISNIPLDPSLIAAERTPTPVEVGA